MTVTVTPEAFTFVSFDAETIRRVAAHLLAALGIDDLVVHIEVDETTPLARTVIDTSAVAAGIRIKADSGAFEDTRRPRQQSETATRTALGRVLLRARDRIRGGFADAPADADLTLAQLAAWETYSIGRLGRIGVPVNQQRWRYNFRNRHGFNDATDAAFDSLWSADDLTWAQLAAISAKAAAPADPK
jgi:hypothetical protein